MTGRARRDQALRMPDGAKAPTAHPQVRAFILCLNTERAPGPRNQEE